MQKYCFLQSFFEGDEGRSIQIHFITHDKEINANDVDFGKATSEFFGTLICRLYADAISAYDSHKVLFLMVRTRCPLFNAVDQKC